jgi:hypothetical protein
MPFADASFDFVVCTTAFKNFADPVSALNEIYRVLKSGGWASIYDLRKDAAREDIDAEVRNMHLSPFIALVTRWTFRLWLLKKAYTREALQQNGNRQSFWARRDRGGRDRLRTAAHQGRLTRRRARCTICRALSLWTVRWLRTSSMTATGAAGRTCNRRSGFPPLSVAFRLTARGAASTMAAVFDGLECRGRLPVVNIGERIQGGSMTVKPAKKGKKGAKKKAAKKR